MNVTVSAVLTLSGTEVQLPNTAITLAQGASLNVSSLTIMTGGELNCADAAVLTTAYSISQCVSFSQNRTPTARRASLSARPSLSRSIAPRAASHRRHAG